MNFTVTSTPFTAYIDNTTSVPLEQNVCVSERGLIFIISTVLTIFLIWSIALAVFVHLITTKRYKSIDIVRLEDSECRPFAEDMRQFSDEPTAVNDIEGSERIEEHDMKKD